MDNASIDRVHVFPNVGVPQTQVELLVVRSTTYTPLEQPERERELVTRWQGRGLFVIKGGGADDGR